MPATSLTLYELTAPKPNFVFECAIPILKVIIVLNNREAPVQDTNNTCSCDSGVRARYELCPDSCTD